MAKDIVYSKEQIVIFNYAEKGILNMIVQAVAGAGKTTTLVECANRMKPNQNILILAHNKSTKETLISKLGERDNIKIYTIHGLGWRMFKEYFDFEPKIDENKYRSYINKNISELGGEFYSSLTGPSKMMYKSHILDLVDKARYNLKQSEKEIRKMATKKYGMALISNECHVVANILKWGQEHRETIDYQDLLWFPSEFGYYTKLYLADIIMLDEAQDASIAQQDLISRCFMRSTRLFAFGDKDQTINSWCGSDTNAFEHLKDSTTFRRDAVELPLTTNYRCGKNIIEYAKQFTNNNIHARDDAPDGEINHEVYLNTAKDGDMILCRNISPLMEVYRKGVSQGQKMYFRGEELGKSLIRNADCAVGETIEEMIKSMKVRIIAIWDFLTKESNLDPRETMGDASILSLLDTIKTMENLPKTVETRNDLEKFVKDVFSEEGKEGIQLSTIHRAKGLEADNVFIICPSLIPSRLSTLDWEIEEEKHLQYVMYTRAKNTLNFVSEKEVPPFYAFAETNSLYTELCKIREDVENEKLF